MSALWLAALPLLTVLGVWLHARRRRRVARALGDPALVRRLVGEDLEAVPWRRAVPVALAALALGVALAGARWAADPPAEAVGAGPVILVLDASSSMLVRDVEPDRLEQLRTAALAAVRALGERPVGLVVFAGRAYALSPPTADRGALELYLDALDPAIVTQTGSALAPALRQAVALILRGEEEAGAVLLITDADALDGVEEIGVAAGIAGRAGIPIYALGAGTPAGGPVPDVDLTTGEVRGFKRDAAGQVAISRLREERLQEVAEASGGAYAALRDPAAVAELLGRLAGAEGSGAGDGKGGGRYRPWALAALLLLLVELGAARRWGRRPGAVSALAALLLAGACQRDDPYEAFGRGDYEAAAAGYQALLGSRAGSPLAHYNLGATLLRLQRYDEARPHLERARAGTADSIRGRAYYNLGNSYLEPAFQGGADPARGDQLRRAIVAYKRALLITPADRDAKWNLELARRLLQQPPQSPRPDPSAGGGGGGGGGGAATGRDNPQPQRGPAGGESPTISRAEAERILSSARDRELAVQREKLRKAQPPAPLAH